MATGSSFKAGSNSDSMKISDLAIDRRTTVYVLLLLILLMGFVSYRSIPRESMPEVKVPFVSVSVIYPGVSPEDMESLVTIPIERKLSGISGIEQIVSTSSEGASIISIEFDPDEPMDEATQKVRDKVDMAKPDLPFDAEDAVVQEANFTNRPILFVNLTGSIGLQGLSEIAEDLEDRIESLPGVLEVSVVGDVERVIQIEVDPIRAAQYGVSLSELVQLTQVENVNMPAGTMNLGAAKYLIRVPGELKSPQDLRDLVVKRGDIGVVYLRDLAEIRDGIKPIESYSRLDGVPSITLIVSKRSGRNVIEVADSVKALVNAAKEKMPPGVSLAVTLDESKEIAARVEGLENSILTGLILVVIVLFLFLGLSNAFFVAMAIPISLLITFTVMNQVGISLNMVSLFSLMVALGMLVDNGIVVVENIYRHAQMGKPKVQAAKEGTAEVAWPIFASTVTTVAAFFPMIFWPGMMGKMMNTLPKTVIIALIASLFVGLIVNPALAAVFVRAKTSKRKKNEWGPVLTAYGAFLRLTLRWRSVTVTTAVTVLIMIVSIYFTELRYEFLPTIDPQTASVNVTGPEGASLESTDRIVRQIEDIVAPERENIEFLIATAGKRGSSGRSMPGRGSGGGQTSHLGSVTLDFLERGDATISPSELINRIRSAFDGIVGAEVRIDETNNMGPPSGPAVNIELNGDEFDVMADLTIQIRERIEGVPGLVDLQDDLEKGKPEIRVIVDRQRAKLAKLNTQSIGIAVQAAVNGRKAAEFRDGEDEYDVIVRFPEKFRNDLSNIESMEIINSDGERIPFTSVARLEEGAGMGSIKHIDRKRIVTISADAEGRLGPDVLRDVKAILAEMPLPPGYNIDYTGENLDTNETMRFLISAFVVALFLIFLVLITQFNSLTQPAIIMSSVILSLAGVFLGLLIFDMPFSVMMTGIGCVSLAGIVVNNGIVLVDFINKLIERGLPLEEAIVEAAKTRFRPVLLTAVTTILGLIPMAIGVTFNFRQFNWTLGDMSSQYWGSMAVAIIFGLGFSTFLTLLVIPTLYSISVHPFGVPQSAREAPRASAPEAALVTK